MNKERENIMNNSKDQLRKAHKVLQLAKDREKGLDLVRVPCFRGFKFIERSKLSI